MVKATKTASELRRVLSVLVGLFFVFFLIATICAGFALFRVNDLVASSTHVDGMVVGTNSDTKGRRAAVIRFQTTNGETRQLKSNLYTSPAPKPGETVKVLYRTSNPDDWQIDDWIHLYFWPMLGSIFMFTWGVAALVTKLAGDYQVRNLERAEAAESKT